MDVLDVGRGFGSFVGATVQDDDVMASIHQPANQMDSGWTSSANHQCACHVSLSSSCEVRSPTLQADQFPLASHRSHQRRGSNLSQQ